MFVKFLVDHAGHKAGDVEFLSIGFAESLISQKVCEKAPSE